MSQCCKPRCRAVNTFVCYSLGKRCTDESQGPSAVMTAVFARSGRCPLEAEFTGAFYEPVGVKRNSHFRIASSVGAYQARLTLRPRFYRPNSCLVPQPP